jgi:hypothetical protein
MATLERSIKGSSLLDFSRGMDLLNQQRLNKGTAFKKSRIPTAGVRATNF